jgi:hypothetical protein
MMYQHVASDEKIATSFAIVLNGFSDFEKYSRRCALSVIASKLDDFQSALPKTHNLVLLDMKSLVASAQAQHETNIISYLEENGYSAALAYQMAKVAQNVAA